ncbi:MAG TPA: response regulator [Blastocatellia bacterium]|nr:response regulator [Blastocatellia bacterium]
MISSPAGRLLCIDDDPDHCELLRYYLSGRDLITARTVADGLRMARNERFDLYLMDLRFSDGNGLELCRQIRGFDPDTPIIFLSGDVRELMREAALAAGGQVFMGKPIDYDRLAETVSALIRSRAAGDSEMMPARVSGEKCRNQEPRLT